MVRKIIGHYSDTQPAGAGQLIIELSHSQVACLVKGADTQAIDGFELFELDRDTHNWSDILPELRAASQLLNKTYRDTHCYYNFEQAIIMPGKRFSAGSAEDYLNLVYGESEGYAVRHESINADDQMVNAYRINSSIHDLIGHDFVLYKPHHTYSALVQAVLSREELPAHFVKIQFYQNHMIAVVVKEKKLQLVQSFRFQTNDDIVYHLGNITEQFELDIAGSQAEVSGNIEEDSSLYKKIQSCFGSIVFDTMEENGVLKATPGYPLHFFTPFYKLVV